MLKNILVYLSEHSLEADVVILNATTESQGWVARSQWHGDFNLLALRPLARQFSRYLFSCDAVLAACLCESEIAATYISVFGG